MASGAAFACRRPCVELADVDFNTMTKFDFRSCEHLESLEVNLGTGAPRDRDLKCLSWLPALKELKLVGASERDIPAIAGLGALQG